MQDLNPHAKKFYWEETRQGEKYIIYALYKALT